MKKVASIFLFLLIISISCDSVFAKKKAVAEPSDREVWVTLLYQMAEPVLKPMSEGRLQEVMSYESGNLEVSPTWDGRNKKVSYMEAFGRLMTGLAPWLSLPDNDTKEGLMRKQVREWAIKSYTNAVDPTNPDYLGWQSGGQTLVDAAFLVQSFHRGWDALWEPLSVETKLRYVHELQQLHRYDPPYQNWFLFCGIEEAFLMKAEASLKKSGILDNAELLKKYGM